MTSYNFLVTFTCLVDWFTKPFIPAAKEFLTKKNLAFKILLLMDNAKCHPEALQTLDPDVEVMFLPPNTTSLIQPMDQTIIATFKAYYLRRVMRRMLRHLYQKDFRIVVEPRQLLKSYWKKFSILDSITIIEESWAETKASTLNARWSKLLPNLVDKGPEQTSQVSDIVQDVVSVSREIGEEGFQDAQEEEFLKLVQSSEELTAEEIVEMLNEPTFSESPADKVAEIPAALTSKDVYPLIDAIQTVISQAIQLDPNMSRSLKFKCECEIAVQPYKDLY